MREGEGRRRNEKTKTVNKRRKWKRIESKGVGLCGGGGKRGEGRGGGGKVKSGREEKDDTGSLGAVTPSGFRFTASINYESKIKLLGRRSPEYG